MLTGIRIKNFKAHRDSGFVPLRPLTVVVGPNNAGKSSLLHSILLLKQSWQNSSVHEPLSTMGPLVDLGPYPELVRGGSGAQTTKLSIMIAADLESLPGVQVAGDEDWEPFIHGANELHVVFGFDAESNRVQVLNSKLARDGEVLEEVRRVESGYASPSLTAAERRLLRPGLQKLLPFFWPGDDLRPGIVDDVTERVLRKGMESQIQAHLWEHVFGSVEYVPPLRTPIPRVSIKGDIPPAALSAGGEGLLASLRETERLGRGDSLISRVDRWISKNIRTIRKLRFVRFDEAGSVASLVADERGYRGINIASMGSGVSQLLPVVAESLGLRRGRVLIVEQPEIHLHPAAQATLGDLFVEQVRGKDMRQILVETHSEHIVLRIRRRVAEGRIPADRVGILFVERTGALPSVRMLDLDSRGHFTDWPEGFFDQSYQDALKLAEAANRPQ